MLKKILIVVALVICGFLTYVALQPSAFFITRQMEINAPAAKIFPWINHSEKSQFWMPWAESDPDVKMVYSGPVEGVGSTASWESQGKMGTGKAVVIESVTNQKVTTQLSYTKPMAMEQVAEISLAPAAQGTVVTWSVKGENSFMGRLFCVFMNMDKMVGGEFEKGLGNLKKLAEAP